MPRLKSKVYNSPHRKKYEYLRIEEGLTFKELEEKAEELGEQISRGSFQRYFDKYIGKSIEERRELIKEDERKFIESKMDKTLDVVQELRSNLGILKEMLNNMIHNKDELEASDVNAIQNCLAETRRTLKEISNLTNQLTIDGSSVQTERNEFRQSLDKLDPEMAEAIIEVVEDDLEG